MEKNGEIRKGVTPVETHPDATARTQMFKDAADKLEEHTTKRTAEKAEECLKSCDNK